jgi:Domain of unknown function (DUF4249)
MQKYRLLSSAVLLLLLAGCVERYDIKSFTSDNRLVINGYLSNNLKQHRVSISRTAKLNEREFIPEANAQVSISDGNGTVFPLTELSPGNYETSVLAGVISDDYFLSVTTQDGNKYVSDRVKLKDTPDIKNIYATYSKNFNIGDGPGGFRIFLDTEDISNQTRYYRWEYEETYQIKMPFPSSYIWLGGSDVIFRDLPIDICWPTRKSSNIFLKSTFGLSQDKVNGHLLREISGGSELMRIKYSLLVRQFSLSKEAYTYWNGLKILNESQGSLFDRQPGNIRGNIKSVSTNEEVLGYFDAGVVKEKRVFFLPTDFYDAGYIRPPYLTGCEKAEPVEVLLSTVGDYLTNHSRDSLLISEVQGMGDVTIFLRRKYCLDCTNQGPNIKPSFWK